MPHHTGYSLETIRLPCRVAKNLLVHEFFLSLFYAEMTLNAQIMNKIWIQQLKSHIGGYWIFSKFIGIAPYVNDSQRIMFDY